MFFIWGDISFANTKHGHNLCICIYSLACKRAVIFLISRRLRSANMTLQTAPSMVVLSSSIAHRVSCNYFRNGSRDGSRDRSRDGSREDIDTCYCSTAMHWPFRFVWLRVCVWRRSYPICVMICFIYTKPINVDIAACNTAYHAAYA